MLCLQDSASSDNKRGLRHGRTISLVLCCAAARNVRACHHAGFPGSPRRRKPALAWPSPTRWSDPATWPNHEGAGGGRQGRRSARTRTSCWTWSPPPLDGLSIDGRLSFSDDADLELTTEWIMLHGELAIGGEGIPTRARATITLTDHVKGEDTSWAAWENRGIHALGRHPEPA